MSNKSQGYIRLPRSLTEDPLYRDARHAHQCVFNRLILLAAYSPQEHDIRGNIILIKPGQLCYSLNKIAELTGKYTSKDDVEGALRHFGRRCHFLLHEVLHQKSIITITHKDTYDLIIKSTPPSTPPPLLHHSSTNDNSDKNNRTLNSDIDGVHSSQVKNKPIAKDYRSTDKQHSIASFDPRFFDPDTYLLPNRQPLSRRCANAFKKYKAEELPKLYAAIEILEETLQETKKSNC